MNCSIVLDWKSLGVLGLTAICLVLVIKMDSNAAGEAFAKTADACKGFAGAITAVADR